MKRALVSAAIAAAASSVSSSPAWAAPASPEAHLSPAVQPGRGAYVVVPGDSFWSIGRRFDVDMKVLAAWNHMELWAPLDAGWTLQVPPRNLGPTSPETAKRRPRGAIRPVAAGSIPTAGTSRAAGGIWACIAAHESGGNPAADTGNGYYGMYQFTLETWTAAGGRGNPADAPEAEQTAIAERVEQQQGWGAWPVTSRECGA